MERRDAEGKDNLEKEDKNSEHSNEATNRKERKKKERKRGKGPGTWTRLALGHTMLLVHIGLMLFPVLPVNAMEVASNSAGTIDQAFNKDNREGPSQGQDNGGPEVLSYCIASIVRISQLVQDQINRHMEKEEKLTQKQLIKQTTATITDKYPRLWGTMERNKQTQQTIMHFVEQGVQKYPNLWEIDELECEGIQEWPQVPQQKGLHLISANVTSSQSNADITTTWGADVAALHEVRLDEQGQRSYSAEAAKRAWSVQHGKAMVRQKTLSGAYIVKQGGVLTQAKRPARVDTRHIGYTQEEHELYDSHRHVTTRVPVNAGRVDGNDSAPEAMIIENAYSGQNKDRELTRLYNRQLRTLFQVAGSRINLPVALCMDTNLPYQTNTLFQQLMMEGDWTDAATLQQSHDGIKVRPTYSKNSNFENEDDKENTTIDAILLNRTAVQLF